MSGFLYRLVSRTLGNANVVRPRTALTYFQAYDGEAQPVDDPRADDGGFATRSDEGGSEATPRPFERGATKLQPSAAARFEIDPPPAPLPPGGPNGVDAGRRRDGSHRDAPPTAPAARESTVGDDLRTPRPAFNEIAARAIESPARATSRITREQSPKPTQSPEPILTPIANEIALQEPLAPLAVTPNVAAKTASSRSSDMRPHPTEPAGAEPARLPEPTSPVPARLEIHDVRMPASAEPTGPERPGRMRQEADPRFGQTRRDAAATSAQYAALPVAREVPVVNVTIGRIEVRAPAASAQPLPARRSVPAPPQPSAALDAYLRGRGNSRP